MLASRSSGPGASIEAASTAACSPPLATSGDALRWRIRSSARLRRHGKKSTREPGSSGTGLEAARVPAEAAQALATLADRHARDFSGNTPPTAELAPWMQEGRTPPTLYSPDPGPPCARRALEK